MSKRSAPDWRRQDLVSHLSNLGVSPGNVVMVHASLRSVGRVHGGPSELLEALLETVGPGGTLMAFVSWAESTYDATLNGRALDARSRQEWPAFDPRTAPPYPGFGALNRFICGHPRVRRSSHPDASMAAIGSHAEYITAPHSLIEGYGPGSPLERMVQLGGKVLLLGAPLDAVTVLHYAEVMANVPGKRRVSYEVPTQAEDGAKTWAIAENFDTNGILDCFATDNGPDAVESIARDYVARGHGSRGRVGDASCHLFDARHLVCFGKQWLESRFGGSVQGRHPAC